MRKKTIVKISAPGKIIFSGEHAVVYGYPALLASTNLRLNVFIEKNPKQNLSGYGFYAWKFACKKFGLNFKRLAVVIDSDIPMGIGMGSSAALAVALSAQALARSGGKWDLEKINKIAYEIEKKQHGNPSGGDNTIVTYGGFLWYRKETENLKVFTSIKPKVKLPKFFLINSGKPEETTREMVKLVREKFDKNPRKIELLFREIENCTKGFLRHLLAEEKLDLGDLIKTNQRLLEELDVVSNQTKGLVSFLEKKGVSVKVSGAGGKLKGSGILLCYHPNPDRIIDLAKTKKLDFFPVKLGGEGVYAK